MRDLVRIRRVAAGKRINPFGRRSLGDMPMDGSSIPVSKRIAITEADSSRPLGAISAPVRYSATAREKRTFAG